MIIFILTFSNSKIYFIYLKYNFKWQFLTYNISQAALNLGHGLEPLLVKAPRVGQLKQLKIWTK